MDFHSNFKKKFHPISSARPSDLLDELPNLAGQLGKIDVLSPLYLNMDLFSFFIFFFPFLLAKNTETTGNLRNFLISLLNLFKELRTEDAISYMFLDLPLSLSRATRVL